MNVYRLEHPDSGLGPYHHTFTDERRDRLNEIIDEYECFFEENAPSIFNDILQDGDIPDDGYSAYWPNAIGPNDEILTGCPTLQKLEDWFGGHFEMLLEMGFKVYELQVTDYIMGTSGKQLAFTQQLIKNKKELTLCRMNQ
jgi:hypothetical protein